MLKHYIKLLRPKHYLKNLLIFLPLVFSGNLSNVELLINNIMAFVAFSLIASSVYIINDIKDVEKDKLHKTKKNRPISSGKVSLRSAVFLCISLIILSLITLFVSEFNTATYALIGIYFTINLLYSFGLKNVPIVDVSILAAGFIIRIFYGGEVSGVIVSEWLYLAVLTFSLYLGLGKRRNELIYSGSETRAVNRFYNKNFLDKNMYIYLALTIMFYAMWTIDPEQEHELVIWTVPVVMIISMSYSLAIEQDDSDGDPINVLTKHSYITLMVAAYGLLLLGLIYLG